MGTLTISYSGSPGGATVNLSETATISDTDAAAFISWAQSRFITPQGKPAAAAAFAAWAKEVFSTAVSQIQQANIQAAAAAVSSITITPS